MLSMPNKGILIWYILCMISLIIFLVYQTGIFLLLSYIFFLIPIRKDIKDNL